MSKVIGPVVRVVMTQIEYNRMSYIPPNQEVIIVDADGVYQKTIIAMGANPSVTAAVVHSAV